MLTNRWMLRTMWGIISLLFALILDRTLAWPPWALVGFIILIGLGWWRIGKPGLIERWFKLDRETATIVRMSLMVFLFFIESVIAAWLVAGSAVTG